jgi:hypothetical protein
VIAKTRADALRFGFGPPGCSAPCSMDAYALRPCIYNVDLTRIRYTQYILSQENKMKTVVQKWGNSLGIRIPSLYVKEFDLKNGSSVEIIEESGKLVIVPKNITLK